MRQTFRVKLMAILGIATCAFAMLIVLGAKLEERADDQLSRIAQTYIPLLELGPRLNARFDELVRGFRDAVAAQDREALHATRALRDACLSELARADALVPRNDAAALHAAVEEYYAKAFEVSRRMLAEETGEGLVDALNEMQGKQRIASALVVKATAFDQAALTRSFATATAAQATARRVRLIVSVSCLTLVLLLCLWLSRSVLRALHEIGQGFARFGRGSFDEPIRVLSNDEFGALAQQANEMARSLKSFDEQRDRSEWLSEGLSGLVREVRGDLEPSAVAERAASYLAHYLSVPAAALYWRSAEGELTLLGHHASWQSARRPPAGPIALGDGLLGQSAREQDLTIVTDLPDDYFPLRSALGEGKPRALVLLPLSRLGQVAGVLELAVTRPWREIDSQLLLSIRESLAIAIEVARARSALRTLLGETQEQAERLRRQEEELRSNNEELHAQRAELLDANNVLKQQATELDLRRGSLALSNAELQEVRRTLERKAQELTAVSAFKSQFLANMSHELRTPLNSMLILSSLLAEHEAGALTPAQTEYCRTIHGAAQNLLALINQVLDLAKVESGKQDLTIEPVRPRDLADYARRLFEPIARDKQLAFSVSVDEQQLPETLATDRRKVEQILNNLLGNALKFTTVGEVSLHIGGASARMAPQRESLAQGGVFSLSVADTGVGIPREHQARIFSPFEQLEAAPDRRFGGSGLGLSIARELATLLGGELRLESSEGSGSLFVCHLPVCLKAGAAVAAARVSDDAGERPSVAPPPAVSRPRAVTTDCPTTVGRRILLVEDERDVARLLQERLAADGHLTVVAENAEAALASLAVQMFDCLVLDLGLPDVDGVELLELLHAQHRGELPPVLIHTGRALGDAQRAWLEAHAETVVLKQGLAVDRLLDEIRLFSWRLAAGVPRRTGRAQTVSAARPSLTGRQLLIVDDDMRTVYALSAQLRAQGIEPRVAATFAEMFDALSAHPGVELVLLDISSAAMSGPRCLEELRRDPRFGHLPVIALAPAESRAETALWLEAGATDYLTKPYDVGLLFAMLSKHLTNAEVRGADADADAKVAV